MDYSVDRSNFRGVLLDYSKQLLFSPKVEQIQGVENVVLAGMGGSARPGRLANCILGRDAVKIHDDYGLPGGVGENTLFVVCSYSGNTEESLDAFEKAEARTKKIVVITSGGKLEKIAVEKGYPFVKIPSGIQPRCASGFMTASFLRVLSSAGKCVDFSTAFQSASVFLEGKRQEIEKSAMVLADRLVDCVPVVYASKVFDVVASVGKIEFNENAKVPCFSNAFPELNHNEMVGFTNSPASFHFIFLENSSDHERVRKRMRITKGLLEARGHGVSSVEMLGVSKLEQVFYSAYFFSWASYHLALKIGQDPTPVDMVELLKEKMRD